MILRQAGIFLSVNLYLKLVKALKSLNIAYQVDLKEKPDLGRKGYFSKIAWVNGKDKLVINKKSPSKNEHDE